MRTKRASKLHSSCNTDMKISCWAFFAAPTPTRQWRWRKNSTHEKILWKIPVTRREAQTLPTFIQLKIKQKEDNEVLFSANDACFVTLNKWTLCQESNIRSLWCSAIGKRRCEIIFVFSLGNNFYDFLPLLHLICREIERQTLHGVNWDFQFK